MAPSKMQQEYASTEATYKQTNFWCIYSHFCDMKS
jgi:hypothetical protein